MEAASKCSKCNTTEKLTTGGSYGSVLCKSCYGKWRRGIKKDAAAMAAHQESVQARWAREDAAQAAAEAQPCNVSGSHCEQCGSAAEGSADNDGYSSCCNELITWGGDCRNHHAR